VFRALGWPRSATAKRDRRLIFMQSEPSNDHEESQPPSEEDGTRLRPTITRALPIRTDRLSSDHIHLSPRAQRRMAMGRRSGF
jgi:hypothetical protein